jgi:hypothetical protein
MLHEVGGKRVLPPLVRSSAGWAEQGPTRCACGGTRFIIGWTACACRTDTLAPGHRTWICRHCEHRTAVGCLGPAGPGPMESYGCRTGEEGRSRAD